MFFPFINWEIIQEPSSTENNTLLKSNLPNDAMILVEYYGDGNGSWFQVYSRNNFSSSDTRLYHSYYGGAAFAGDNFAQIARKGSDLYYDSDDISTGRGSVRVHLLYLPDRQADTVLP